MCETRRMKHAFIMCLIGLAPLSTAAQDVSKEEMSVLAGIASCLLEGVPKDWREAEMNVVLPEPGSESGEATYLVMRNLSGGAVEPFAPCDVRSPAKALTDMRKLQSAERAGWKSARFQIFPDGKFGLKFDYPK